MKIAFLMDPIKHINIKKDTTFAMLLEAQCRDWDVYYCEAKDLWLENGSVYAKLKSIHVQDESEHWFDLSEEKATALNELDVLMMRKDPPFDINYIHLTYLLEQAEAKGLKVINKPSSLRDANEKLFTAWFPQCCPNTLVSSSKTLLKKFVAAEKYTVLKPLGEMAGRSIFKVNHDNQNLNVIIEMLTQDCQRMVMAQQFIPEITQGDKRILMINGEPIPYALARIPSKDDFRGNLAAGATGEGRELTERDRWICQQVGPTLKAKGLIFVGLDVIGDYLTEINVTSPTGVRELDRQFNLNICKQLMDCIKNELH